MKTLFIFALAACVPLSSSAQHTAKELTLVDIWQKGTFRQKSISGLRSTANGTHYTSLIRTPKGQAIVKYEYKTGKLTDTLVNTANLKDVNGKTLVLDGYLFSDDEQQLLLQTEQEFIYRHSTKENNYLYQLATKTLKPLSLKGKQMYARFSPDGKKIAFVRENNLYINEPASNTETQITQDGAFNKIINGANDWVYEEEFSFDISYAWSPNGSKIAYYKFDESAVKQFTMPMYTGQNYPEEYTFKYPKAGEANSHVTLHVYHLATQKTVDLEVGAEKDQYIPRMQWTHDDNTVSFQRLNRLQNKLELILADAGTGKSTVILTDENKTYIDVTEELTFLKDKKTFIWGSGKNGFHHLYHYDLKGKLINQITQGNFDVKEFYGINEKNNTLYFASTERGAINQDLYCINLNGKNKKLLSPLQGTSMANFSSTFDYYINFYSNANQPLYITLHDGSGKEIRVLENNQELKDKLKDYQLRKKEFFQFKTAEGHTLNGWMITPPNFDSRQKYPVLLTIYGGPGRNTVVNQWGNNDFIWHQLLAQKGVIVVSVDNRGTQGRGEEFRKCTYGRLGELETLDQISTARYLQSLPYVDSARIGVQGWSFGGYLSSLLITKGNSYFNYAIAVAPVTNWRLYDNIYTERFLGLPQNNAKGYDENSPLNFANLLKGKYLIIHGSADDNVHMQNTLEMAKRLQDLAKPFDMEIYTDKNHGIVGPNTRLHLFTKMTDFILNANL